MWTLLRVSLLTPSCGLLDELPHRIPTINSRMKSVPPLLSRIGPCKSHDHAAEFTHNSTTMREAISMILRQFPTLYSRMNSMQLCQNIGSYKSHDHTTELTHNLSTSRRGGSFSNLPRNHYVQAWE